jgi:RimJ/RimL family protein N-acetyltransferase
MPKLADPAPFRLRAPPVLEGRAVRLEPYHEGLKLELQAALDVDPHAWSLFPRAGYGEHFDSWWASSFGQAEARVAQNFAVRRKSDGAIVGTTSYLGIRPADLAVEIGATFYRPEARGGIVNPEAKRLLLAHAFADGPEPGLFEAPAHRVEIVVDARNLRSQAAVRKLGAHLDGVLRQNKVTWTGHVRDTVVFSIIHAEWPMVRDKLESRLSALAAT